MWLRYLGWLLCLRRATPRWNKLGKLFPMSPWTINFERVKIWFLFAWLYKLFFVAAAPHSALSTFFALHVVFPSPPLVPHKKWPKTEFLIIHRTFVLPWIQMWKQHAKLTGTTKIWQFKFYMFLCYRLCLYSSGYSHTSTTWAAAPLSGKPKYPSIWMVVSSNSNFDTKMWFHVSSLSELCLDHAIPC